MPNLNRGFSAWTWSLPTSEQGEWEGWVYLRKRSAGEEAEQHEPLPGGSYRDLRRRQETASHPGTEEGEQGTLWWGQEVGRGDRKWVGATETGRDKQ